MPDSNVIPIPQNPGHKGITHKEGPAHVESHLSMIIGKHVELFQFNRSQTAITPRRSQMQNFEAPHSFHPDDKGRIQKGLLPTLQAPSTPNCRIMRYDSERGRGMCHEKCVSLWIQS